MSIKISQNSFSKGILSPSLQGRVDLEQYSNGVKNLHNGIILQEGCIINRSGLEFVAKTKYSNKKSKLIPFIFGLDQNYIIELGDKYIRFIKDGGYILNEENKIYEIDSPYKIEDLFEIDYIQQADVITITHKNYPINELSRITHNHWELKEISISPNINPPENLTISYTGSTSSNTKTYSYVVCTVDKETNEESQRSEIISILAHKEAYMTTSEYITLNWDEVENAQEYNIYKSANGIFGYIGTSNSTSFIDDNIEPDLSSCAPIATNPFENQNPSAVCYFQQRKIYANSNKNPQTFWASQTGANNNFNISRPLNPTDSINMTLCDNVASEIQYLLPFNDLIIMSTNSEWAIKGADNVFSANPTPSANIQSFYGCAKIKPIISGSMVIFVQSGGNIIRDLGYNYLSDSYDGEELSLFANQLFKGKKIVDMSYSKEPYRILWCIMDDGTINALTYNPKQKISAWHTHSTKGEFESIATIRENNEDISYFTIKRIINNEEVRYIERFKTRTYKTLDDSFLLDCAIKQTFETEVKKITNLQHLKNETVCLLLDNGVVENIKINSQGELTLPYSAKNVLIGLPYIFKLETLNIEAENTFGNKKIINQINVKILESREDFFIENDNETLIQNSRSIESINNPEKLFDKTITFCPLSNPESEKNITIIQKYPLPLNILAINAVVSLEETEQL